MKINLDKLTVVVRKLNELLINRQEGLSTWWKFLHLELSNIDLLTKDDDQTMPEILKELNRIKNDCDDILGSVEELVEKVETNIKESGK